MHSSGFGLSVFFLKTMRIIGGEAKGKRLHFPAGLKERPTSDFIREALFNLLGSMHGKIFLDLFSGSGSVGIEAASRGAEEVIFVEKEKKIAAIAQKNAEEAGLGDKCRIMAMDAGRGLGFLCLNGYEFDVIFADPPYDRGLAGETIKLLKKNSVLKRKALVVIQHSSREDLSSILDKENILIDQRKYGDNILTFLKMEEP